MVSLKVLEVDNVVDNVVDIKLKNVLRLIMADKRISAGQIADKLSLSSRTVQRYIKQLKEKKLLQRIGDDKTGHWKLIK